MEREEIMQQWDRWRKYIAEGGKRSWPRDAFEALLDELEAPPRMKIRRHRPRVIIERMEDGDE